MKRILIVAVVVSGLFAAAVWTAVFLSQPVVAEGATFTVEAGDGVDAIVARLKADGVIRSELLFKLALRSTGLATRIQPGVHDLSGIGSYEELAKELASGNVTAEEDVLLLREGETLRHLKAALEQLGHPAAEGLYGVTGAPAEPGGAGWELSLAEEFDFLAGVPAGASLEGFLFPDTYRVFKDATAEDVVRVMLENTDRKLTAELRREIASSGRTMYETIVMASIVEREVRGMEDMRMVADLFWRRYDANMGLQADSTVNYVTGKKLPAVTYADTQVDSLYNTYKYRGLPYGPIGNPGLDAIVATVDPLPNDYWYFLTDPEGNVHYAENLDGHNRNKAEHLR